MIYDDTDGVIPAGRLPQDMDKEPAPAEQAATKIKVGEKEMDPSDLAKSYVELEKKLGSQGSELGKYRSQTELLMNQLATMQEQMGKGRQADTNQNQDPDFDAMRAEITKAIDSGEISLEEGNAKMWDILDQKATLKSQRAAEKAVLEAKRAFDKAQQDKDAEQVQSRFLEKNKDFLEFRDSEEAARIKAENPLHDDVSAYYEFKANTAMQKYEELANRIESGARPKGPVVDKPGNAIRSQNLTKPRSMEERRQAAYAAAGVTRS